MTNNELYCVVYIFYQTYFPTMLALLGYLRDVPITDRGLDSRDTSISNGRGTEKDREGGKERRGERERGEEKGWERDRGGGGERGGERGGGGSSGGVRENKKRDRGGEEDSNSSECQSSTSFMEVERRMVTYAEWARRGDANPSALIISPSFVARIR